MKYSTVYIKGTNKGVVVTNDIAEQIKAAKKKGIDGWLDLNGWSGNVSEIKHIFDGVDESNRENYKEELKNENRLANEQGYQEVEKEYFAQIKKVMFGTDAEKIKYNLTFASFICHAITGLWLKEWGNNNPNEFKQLTEVVAENIKTHFVVNPTKYKHIFPFADSKKNIESIARSGAFRIVEKHLMEAVHTSNLILKTK